MIDGEATLWTATMATGDAAKIEGPEDVVVAAPGTAELILIDVPLEFHPVGVWAGRN